jgi:hypothetical protein
MIFKKFRGEIGQPKKFPAETDSSNWLQVSTTLFVIPAILIAACYIVIVCTIWNKGKEMAVS